MDARRTPKKELEVLIEAVRRGDYAVAIEGLKSFLQAHPDHEVATGLLAAAYFQIGMTDHARTLYRRLLAVHPGNALARFQLGLVCLDGDPREAITLWQPLLEVEQEFMAHFHSALAHLRLGERSAAQPLLDHAAKYMPESHPLRSQLHQLQASFTRNDMRSPGYSR